MWRVAIHHNGCCTNLNGTELVTCVQVHTTAYPDGALRAQFNNESIITGSAEAVYGTNLVDYTTRNPLDNFVVNLQCCRVHKA